MPGPCCREQHRPLGGQVSNAHQIQVRWPENPALRGEGPARAQCCWKHLHAQPGIARTALGTAGDGSHPPLPEERQEQSRDGG